MFSQAEKYLDVNECKELVKKHAHRFTLDTLLCDPTSLKLTKKLLIEILESLEKSLPEHLKDASELKIILQADIESFIELSKFPKAVLRVYNPSQGGKHLYFKLTINPDSISLKKIPMLNESENPSSEQSIPELSAPTKTRPFVVFVDDNLVIHKVVSRFMISIDKTIGMTTLQNGQEFVDHYTKKTHLHNQTQTLIFMDLQMPILRGDDAIIKIRAFEKEKGLKPIPIICVTANSEVDLNNLLRIGATAICSKPYKKDTLIEKLVEFGLLAPPQNQAALVLEQSNSEVGLSPPLPAQNAQEPEPSNNQNPSLLNRNIP